MIKADITDQLEVFYKLISEGYPSKDLNPEVMRDAIAEINRLREVNKAEAAITRYVAHINPPGSC